MNLCTYAKVSVHAGVSSRSSQVFVFPAIHKNQDLVAKLIHHQLQSSKVLLFRSIATNDSLIY